MSNKLVSIIIPSFNSAQWVCNAIDSSLQQTYSNCEVIVIDDGSTDNTRELIFQRYGETVKYIYQNNQGVASARNNGLSNASGEYIQFLDADDLIAPSKIAKQVALLEDNPEFDVAYSDFKYFCDDNSCNFSDSPELFKSKYSSGDILNLLLSGNFIVIHAALVKKKAVIKAGSFDCRMVCEDYDLWLRIANNGGKFIYSGGELAFYRVLSGSRSSNKAVQLIATIDVIKNISNYHKLVGQSKVLANRYLSELYSELSDNYIDQLKHYQALSAAILSCLYDVSKKCKLRKTMLTILRGKWFS